MKIGDRQEWHQLKGSIFEVKDRNLLSACHDCCAFLFPGPRIGGSERLFLLTGKDVTFASPTGMNNNSRRWNLRTPSRASINPGRGWTGRWRGE